MTAVMMPFIISLKDWLMNMININVDLICRLLKYYTIEAADVSYNIIDEGYGSNQNDSEIRIILRVNTNKNKYIMKIIKEKSHPTKIMEQQSVFSEILHDNNIPVAKRYLSIYGTYCCEVLIDGYGCSLSLQEDFGNDELQTINKDNIIEIAELMAEMHIIIQQNDCHIKLDTIWNFFNTDSEIVYGYNDYVKYRDLTAKSGLDTNKYDLIIKRYISKKEKLQKRWCELHKYAVQGDLSTNNFIIDSDKKIIGLIDFNIAGDDVLISDLITQGIFVCYIMDLDEGLNDDDRKQLFDLFINSYQNIRAISNTEKSFMNDIYSIVYSMFWTRTDLFINNLKDGKLKDADMFLDETLDMLNNSYFERIL